MMTEVLFICSYFFGNAAQLLIRKRGFSERSLKSFLFWTREKADLFECIMTKIMI